MEDVIYRRTNEDFIKILGDQLTFLNLSLSTFSENSNLVKKNNKVIGNPLNLNSNSEIESLRIATIVRVLVHDTPQSISLLKSLERKSIKFIDTAPLDDSRLHSMTGMVGVRGSNSNQYLGLVGKIKAGKNFITVPLFEQHLPEWYKGYPKVDFDNWWDKEVIKIKGQGTSRKNLILKVVNKDGGAHVDPYLPIEYHELKNNKVTINIKGIDTNFERSIVYASVAQIGWELLNSINKDDFI
jgi:hypothetical protein